MDFFRKWNIILLVSKQMEDFMDTVANKKVHKTRFPKGRNTSRRNSHTQETNSTSSNAMLTTDMLRLREIVGRVFDHVDIEDYVNSFRR